MAVNFLEKSQIKDSYDDLTCYIKRVQKYENLSAEKELETVQSAQNGSSKARELLINSNLKLVVSIALKLVHRGKLPLIDLIQEGNTGLIAAIDKFNWKFGYRFATYATWWIKQAMFKAISEQSHSVRIPVYIQETLAKYSKVKNELEKKTNNLVSIDEVAKKMNISSEKINNYLNANKITLSLEADFEIRNGSEVKLADIIEDKKNSVLQKIERDNLKKDVSDLIKNLKEREQKVITLRFGLNGNEKQTLEEIGKIYGVTKECIRQTENRALRKLKDNKKSLRVYADYLK